MHTQVSVHAYTKCICIFIYLIVLLSVCITVYPLIVLLSVCTTVYPLIVLYTHVLRQAGAI